MFFELLQNFPEFFYIEKKSFLLINTLTNYTITYFISMLTFIKVLFIKLYFFFSGHPLHVYQLKFPRFSSNKILPKILVEQKGEHAAVM